jgi:surface protein
VYQVNIQGKFPRIYFNNGGDRNKILSVDQWGNIEWTNMQAAFYGCENMQILASDAPDLSKVTTIQQMFRGTKFNNSIEHWNISNVTDMSYLFQDNDVYNQPLNNWNTSSVTNMHQVFQSAPAFNQPLNNRDTSKVTNMLSMFNGAKSFNQNINNRNTSNVNTMH